MTPAETASPFAPHVSTEAVRSPWELTVRRFTRHRLGIDTMCDNDVAQGPLRPVIMDIRRKDRRDRKDCEIAVDGLGRGEHHVRATRRRAGGHVAQQSFQDGTRQRALEPAGFCRRKQ